MTLALEVRWFAVCGYAELQPERGVCALVDGRQVAVFRTYDGAVHAVANFDPVGRAYVLSRGIVGSRAGVPTVASPLHKTVYDLRTGRGLDGDARVEVYPARVVDGRVEVGVW